MRAVIQRVSQASVAVGGEGVAAIGPGMLVLLGVGKNDAESDAEYLADKILQLRIFRDAAGDMDRSLAENPGLEILVVSQFTLFGDCRKGRRPSFTNAAGSERACELYVHFAGCLAGSGARVATGRFGAEMRVRLENDGPVTILLDSKKEF